MKRKNPLSQTDQTIHMNKAHHNLLNVISSPRVIMVAKFTRGACRYTIYHEVPLLDAWAGILIRWEIRALVKCISGCFGTEDAEVNLDSGTIDALINISLN